MFFGRLITFLVINHVCEAYKIFLVFPVPGRSHAILGEGYVRHLLDDGHEVTYVTALPMKTAHARLRQIDVSSNYKLMPTDELFDTKNVLDNILDYKDARAIIYAIIDFAHGTITHSEVQRLINNPNEHFDAVIVEWLYSELYAGFASVFNCPLIWSSSMDPHSLVMDLVDDVLNPAYNPQHPSDSIPPFDFWNRVKQLWTVITTKYFKWRLLHVESEIFIKAFETAVAKRGRSLPSFYEAKYNGSLMLGNSHISAGTSISLPPNYIPIGGYHINEKIDPLPPNLQKVADEAKNGFIFFSMGSMMKTSRIPDDMKRGLINLFGRLNQTIIWKFEEKLADPPKNIHIISWAPQPSILAHPNCKLFITHGGLLSIYESLYFGVPMIGMPMFGDQTLNVNRIAEKGLGKRVNLDNNVAVNMESAIMEILQDPRYYEKAKHYSFIYHDRLTPPGKVLTHWVKHVIRTKGASHLRVPGFNVPWYQKAYYDLAILLLVIMHLTVIIITRIVNRLLNLVRSGRSVIKQKKM